MFFRRKVIFGPGVVAAFRRWLCLEWNIELKKYQCLPSFTGRCEKCVKVNAIVDAISVKSIFNRV